MNTNERFQHLLIKYQSNHLSALEYKEFLQLIQEVGEQDNSVLDTQVKIDWAPSKELLQQFYMENKKEQRIRRRKHFMAWSSAAAIALLVMSYLFFWPRTNSGNILYQTTYGETQNIELPDGSQVLLNANSTLSWNGAWKKTRRRLVELEGEAFFDVVKVDNVPFEVNASDITIYVLGTEFNVRNRAMDAEVFLHEGKVDLSVASGANQKITLKPGDFVRFDKSDQGVLVMEDEQMDRKAAWVEGMLEFENKKVSLILREFQDLYGKQFQIENADLADRRMDFSLPYADWELVRKALEIAIGAEFIESRDTIIVK